MATNIGTVIEARIKPYIEHKFRFMRAGPEAKILKIAPSDMEFKSAFEDYLEWKSGVHLFSMPLLS